MATATIIPDRIWELPCIHTAVGTYRYPRQEEDTPELTDAKGDVSVNPSPNMTPGFTITKICQRPLDTDTVDIWFRVGFEGEWVLDIEDCGYEDSDGNWYQLKPAVGDSKQDGTLVAANAGGTAVTYMYEAKAARPNIFRLVWDASDYGDFLSDPLVSIKFVMAPYPTHTYYSFNAVSPVGDNGQGSQTAITKPAKISDYEKELFHLFQKGFTASPYIVNHIITGLQVVFTLDASSICSCYTICGSEVAHGLCPDNNTYILDIPATSVPSSDPFRQSVTFEDSLGNETDVIVRDLKNVIPPAPTVTLVTGTQMTVDINYTHGAFDLSDDAEWYRIERYMGTENNQRLVVDWTLVTGTDQQADTTSLIDSFTYGYRVQLRTKNGSLSSWSAWTTKIYST